MAYPNSSYGGGVMRNHGSQPPHRSGHFSRRHIRIIIRNNRPHSATMHGRAQAPGDLVTHDSFIRQAPAPFYDGEVIVLDAPAVSSAAEETAATPQTVNGLSKEVISRFLKTTVIEKLAAADGDGDPEVCSVCLDLYREKQRVGVLGCRHQFHADCIGEWLQKNSVCPLCNAIGIVRNQD